MKKTGAEIVIECLVREKVEYVFGIPGGVVLPLFDKIYDAPFKFILTRHEQGAAHMADGYARATGRVGVCIATSGPGAANLTTGLATANMDSIPLVAITGQVATHLVGNDAFQEADTTGITRPITKHNYLVKDVRELARIIKEAFYLARTGRPGPVVIDLPVDVQRAETEFSYPEKMDIRGYAPNYEGHPGQIKKALEMIDSSMRPVILAGGGVIISNASPELVKLAEKNQIPVTCTLMALGALPHEHPLFLGMPGMHGTYYANHSLQNSDLILAVGCRFDDRVTGKLSAFAPKAKIIHIDIDPTSISKNVRADIPIVGDAKIVLQELLKGIKKASRAEWLKKIEQWRQEGPLIYKQDTHLRPQYVIEQIAELTKSQAVVCTEVGQNQMWSAQFYKHSHPRGFITSGGLGTMGFGFPAAIGASFGCPDKIVFDIAGDGSFQMNIQELATAVGNKVPVKVAILNNGYLGMVGQWQRLFYNKRYSCSYLRNSNPDFVKVAEAYGAWGKSIKKKEEVIPAIKESLEIKDRPSVLDFWVEPEEDVFPMVPSGAAIDEIMRGLA